MGIGEAGPFEMEDNADEDCKPLRGEITGVEKRHLSSLIACSTYRNANQAASIAQRRHVNFNNWRS
jgi:hypothetical protein